MNVFRALVSGGSSFLVALAVAGCNVSYDVKTSPPSISYNSSSKSGSGSTQISSVVTSKSTETTQKSEWSGADGKMNSIVTSKSTKNGIAVRYSERNVDGVQSKIEAKGDITFSKGKPAKWAADAVVKLFEKRKGLMKEGELRPDAKQMKLWMRKGDSFQPGSDEDRAWADELLTKFNLADR